MAPKGRRLPTGSAPRAHHGVAQQQLIARPWLCLMQPASAGGRKTRQQVHLECFQMGKVSRQLWRSLATAGKVISS